VRRNPIPLRVRLVEKPHSISPPLALALALPPAALFFARAPASVDHAARRRHTSHRRSLAAVHEHRLLTLDRVVVLVRSR
jgi:hypothetical protein